MTRDGKIFLTHERLGSSLGFNFKIRSGFKLDVRNRNTCPELYTYII